VQKFSRSFVLTTERIDGYRWARGLKDGRNYGTDYFNTLCTRTRKQLKKLSYKRSALMIYQYNRPKAVPKM
jgi:hypothetical protein